jgi:hypothetical protein
MQLCTADALVGMQLCTAAFQAALMTIESN